MKKRYIVICLFLLLMVYLYINRNIYYISKWGMYIKIENVNDTTIVNISKTRWHWGDNYIKYRPESAEMTFLDIHPIKDTLYVIERNMNNIIETHIKDYKVKEVQFIRCYTQRDYWTDSTFIKENPHEWISINHRHGIYKSWK